MHSAMKAHLLGEVLSWEHQQSPGAALLMSASAAVVTWAAPKVLTNLMHSTQPLHAMSYE